MKDLGMQPATLTPNQWDVLLNEAQSAGTKVISLGVSWSSYEPDGRAPAGEWTNLDAFVNDVRKRGMLIRFQLAQIPNWARSAGSPRFSSEQWYGPTTAAELGGWSDFVHRVVSHFGSEVSYYEIWNEENGSTFWSQGANPTEYARLLETSYAAAKAADAGATIMFGGLDRNDAGFLSAVYRAENVLYPSSAVTDHHFFNILGVHPYSGNRAPTAVLSGWVHSDQWGTMDENYTGFELLHTVMTQYGEGTKHIYIGEYGFSTASWNSFPGVPDVTRAQYLAQAFQLAAAAGYVDGLSWFCFYATPWDPSSWALLLGSGPHYQGTATWKALLADTL
jgi:hypothetical protein